MYKNDVKGDDNATKDFDCVRHLEVSNIKRYKELADSTDHAAYGLIEPYSLSVNDKKPLKINRKTAVAK